MPIEPADEATRDVIWDILSRFLGDYERPDGPFSTLLDRVYCRYPLWSLDADGLASMLSKDSGVEMMTQNLFLHLEPIKKNILPLVTLQSSNDWVIFRIYALLTTLDENCNLQSLAIRFETDEGGISTGSNLGLHDFCHAQLCNNINKHVKNVTPQWVPDSQPSIPLDADNQVSLVLCMLTSLYGGKHVFSRLSDSSDRDLWEHLEKVRALQAFKTTN